MHPCLSPEPADLAACPAINSFHPSLRAHRRCVCWRAWHACQASTRCSSCCWPTWATLARWQRLQQCRTRLLSRPSSRACRRREQWHHALATLHAARGDAATALRIRQQVADGELASPAGAAVQAAEATEAFELAAALLRDPAAWPAEALLSHIRWLTALFLLKLV